MKDRNIYVKTYLRVESGYVWGKGMDDDKYKKFADEIKKLFTSLGFTIKEPEFISASLEVERGAENLYCHPQSLSGELKKGSIKEIEKVLKKAKTFEHYKTDTYEKMFNYTAEELREELNNSKGSIELQILELFKTKRKNLYKSSSPLWDFKTDIKFFRDTLELKNIERAFIMSTFKDLITSGKIKESENRKVGKIYRAVTN